MVGQLLLGTAAVAVEEEDHPGTVVVVVEGDLLGTAAGVLDLGTVEEELLPGTEPAVVLAVVLVPGTVAVVPAVVLAVVPDLGIVVAAEVAGTVQAGEVEEGDHLGTGPEAPQAAGTAEGSRLAELCAGRRPWWPGGRSR